MYSRLFAGSGLSLDRLRTLVEVGAWGSIARAAGNDLVRQSQYSRQIKELEDFFQAGLVERHGRGIRLTTRGRELARISRFFLLGLSNFQRGCLAEGQSYRLGSTATFAACFLLPLLADARTAQPNVHFQLRPADENEMERGLHDLTLDFAFCTRANLSRPLQTRLLGSWGLDFWVPKSLAKSEKYAVRCLAAKSLPIAWPEGELEISRFQDFSRLEPALVCTSFIEARSALDAQGMAAVLPSFLRPGNPENFLRVPISGLEGFALEYHLAWNPRLLRLNPHAEKRRDTLLKALKQRQT
jgi:DNA-binding transcriptional LysR family regulator